MRRADVLLLFSALMAMPPAVGTAREPPAPPAASPEPSEPNDPNGRAQRFTFEVGAEVTYEDNICQLSKAELRKFDGAQGSNRCSIEKPQDTITEGKLDFRWETRPFPRRETAVLGSLDAHRYVRSGIKDYQEFGLAISQELTASRRHLALLRAGFQRVPSFYVRELTDDDASFAAGRRIRESATYALSEYGLAYRQVIVTGRLESILRRRYEIRDYNHHFQERDSVRDMSSLELQVRPFGSSKIRLSGAYEGGTLDAEGDLPSTPIPDDDVSYRHRALSFETVFPWGARRRGRLELSATGESRTFTTDNAFDTCHSGRKDSRRDYRARLFQRLASGLDLIAEVRRRSNDVSFLMGFSSCEDDTEYTDNRFGIGLAWRMNLGSR